MCGINGIIYKNTNPHLAEIKKMNMAIRHRGPDDEGVYKFENIFLEANFEVFWLYLYLVYWIFYLCY